MTNNEQTALLINVLLRSIFEH